MWSSLLIQGKGLDFSMTEPTLKIAVARLPPNATAEMIAAAEETRKTNKKQTI